MRSRRATYKGEGTSDEGVAKGLIFDDEVVWVANNNELDSITCFPGGRCGYEAVFNLFPWAFKNQNNELIATQLFASFMTEDIVRNVTDTEYGLSSEMMIQLARDLYSNFVGLYAQFAGKRLTKMALSLAGESRMYVQTFYDAEATLMSEGIVPEGPELTRLIKSRFESVKQAVIASEGAIGADFVVNSGFHFKVYRMRDMVPGSKELEWHVIDAWWMQRGGRGITKDDFDKRKRMSQTETMDSLMDYAFKDNPQATAVVFRPKITKDANKLELWLGLWAAARDAGNMFSRTL